MRAGASVQLVFGLVWVRCCAHQGKVHLLSNCHSTTGTSYDSKRQRNASFPDCPLHSPEAEIVYLYLDNLSEDGD